MTLYRTTPCAALLAAALLAMSPAAGCAQNASLTPPSQAANYHGLLVQQFRAVAFDAEFQPSAQARPRGRIIKWTGPVRAQLFGTRARAYAAEVESHLKALRRLTGLDIRLLGPDEMGENMKIFIMPWREFPAIPGGGQCFTVADYYTSGPRAFAINAATVQIAEEEDYRRERCQADAGAAGGQRCRTELVGKLRRHCIVEELTQALGLTNDSGVFADSIFNDEYHGTRLEAWDAMMVLTLYQPSLLPGMTVNDALPIAARFMRDIVDSERAARVAGQPPAPPQQGSSATSSGPMPRAPAR